MGRIPTRTDKYMMRAVFFCVGLGEKKVGRGLGGRSKRGFRLGIFFVVIFSSQQY